MEFKRKNYGLFEKNISEIGNWPIEDSNVTWNVMSSIIRRVTRYFSETKGYQLEATESWWWSGEVEKAIKKRRTHFKTWKKDKSEEIYIGNKPRKYILAKK